MTNTINLFVLSFSYPIVNWKKKSSNDLCSWEKCFFVKYILSRSKTKTGRGRILYYKDW